MNQPELFSDTMDDAEITEFIETFFECKVDAKKLPTGFYAVAVHGIPVATEATPKPRKKTLVRTYDNLGSAVDMAAKLLKLGDPTDMKGRNALAVIGWSSVDAVELLELAPAFAWRSISTDGLTQAQQAKLVGLATKKR